MRCIRPKTRYPKNRISFLKFRYLRAALHNFTGKFESRRNRPSHKCFAGFIKSQTDKYIGKRGTEKREAFEQELKLDLLGQTIKKIRKERHLTQEQLGALVGVKKAQISKIENHLTDARFETILKVFRALNAKINFSVEL